MCDGEAAAKAAVNDLQECCFALRALRSKGSLDASDVDQVLAIFRRLESLPVSRDTMKDTGIGLIVNHACFRAHEDAAVRRRCRALVAGWKVKLGFCRRQPDDLEASAKRRRVASRGGGRRAGNAATFGSRRSFGAGASPEQVPKDDSEGDSSPAAAEPQSEDIVQWPVQRLKSRIKELGLNPAGCIEKSELIALLKRASCRTPPSSPTPQASAAAQPPPYAPGTPPAQAPAGLHGAGAWTMPRRSGQRLTVGSFGRMSLLRGRRKSRARQSAGLAANRSASQRAEVRRILSAGDALDVFGMKELFPGATKGTPAVGADELIRERRKAILRRYHELCRLVHPDKCPAELGEAATQAFQRLEDAKKQVTSAGFKQPSPATQRGKATQPDSPRFRRGPPCSWRRTAWGGR